ncbi:MAG: DUF4835 family protein [Ignavibacteria bacterium]|nr:DUF4835 family protein [Ignavibacteria bacterium]
MRKIFKIFLIISLLMLISETVRTQDFAATVIVNFEALPSEARDRLRDFKQQVEDYLNKNKFADDLIKEECKILLTLQFNFRGTNGFDNYEAQLLAGGQWLLEDTVDIIPPTYITMFRYLDDRCSFTYNRAMPFIKNDVRFDSFLSLVDYYAYIILGYNEDSYIPKGGNKYFQKALDICNKPMTDRRGWTEGGTGRPSRAELVQELLNSRMEDFRIGYYEYQNKGVDEVFFSQSSKKPAFDVIIQALEKIAAVKKKEVKTYNIDYFFEAKSREIAQLFSYYGDRSVYDKLMKIDQAHQTVYEEFKAKVK